MASLRSPGDYGLASMRRCQRFPPCLMEPMAASSKTCCRPTGTVVLPLRQQIKQGGKKHAQWQPDSGYVKQSSRIRSVEEEVLQVPEQIPLQPVVRAVMSQAVPLQPMKVHGRTGIHLQPMEDPMREPKGGCEPWETHTGADPARTYGLWRKKSTLE